MYTQAVPIDVNTQERLRAIAEATLEVAEARGADGVTMRAVAEKMGGSTTLVTNYIPNRAGLLTNAVAYAFEQWQEELNGVYAASTPDQRLAAVATWSCSTTGNDTLIRRLLIEMLARSTKDSALQESVRKEAHEHREELQAAAAESDVPDPVFAADVLHLVLRGYYLSNLEEPDAWTTERVVPVVQHLVRVLSASPE
jgi:AcrR family transcriptional regulator